MSEDHLVAVSRADCPALRKWYLRNWTLNLLGYETIDTIDSIDTLIRWTDQRPDTKNIQICLRCE